MEYECIVSGALLFSLSHKHSLRIITLKVNIYLFQLSNKNNRKISINCSHLCTPALPLHIPLFSFLIWAYEVKKI